VKKFLVTGLIVMVLVMLALAMQWLAVATPVMAKALTDNPVNPDPGVVLVLAIVGAIVAVWGTWASQGSTPLTGQKIASMIIGAVIGGAGAYVTVDLSGATSSIMAYVLAFLAGAAVSTGTQLIGVKHYQMKAQIKKPTQSG